MTPTSRKTGKRVPLHASFAKPLAGALAFLLFCPALGSALQTDKRRAAADAVKPQVHDSTTAAPTIVYAVRVGIFGNPGNAERMEQNLLASDYPAYVLLRVAGGRELRSVFAGAASSRAEARELASAVQSKLGLDTYIESHPASDLPGDRASAESVVPAASAVPAPSDVPTVSVVPAESVAQARPVTQAASEPQPAAHTQVEVVEPTRPVRQAAATAAPAPDSTFEPPTFEGGVPDNVIELATAYRELQVSRAEDSTEWTELLTTRPELARMASLDAFLAPFFELGELLPVNAFTIVVGFRLDEADEGSDQIRDWRFGRGGRSGSQEVWMRDGVREDPQGQRVTWRRGDPIELNFRWAATSERVPVPSVSNGIQNETLTIEWGGTWAILDVVRLCTLDAPVPCEAQHVGSAVHLEFTVPTQTRVTGGGRPVATKPTKITVSLQALDPRNDGVLPFPAWAGSN